MTSVSSLLLVLGLLVAQVAPPQTLPGRGQTTPPRPTAPGAVIGRIVDAENKPAAGVEVRTMRRILLNGVSQLVSYGEVAETDTDGRYRLANRQPGEYLVVANPYTRDPARLRMHVRRTPAATPGPDGRPLGYVITYFPGSAEEREGQTITVGTAEVADMNFTMARRPVFTVTGRVEFPSQAPGAGRGSGPIATLSVAPARIADQMAGLNVRAMAVGADGAFEVSELPDGEYRLSYRGAGLWAEGTVTVAGAAPSPIAMSLRPDVAVSGRIEFKGATPAPALAPPAPGGIPQVSVELRPAVITAGASFISVPFQTDGTFGTRAGGPGPFVLRARLPAPWIQVSGFIDGVDTLDLPWTPAAAAKDAVIVATDRRTALLISVRDETDRMASDATVIVFSEDSRYWSARSRRVQIVALTPGGTVTLPDIPPGKYFVLAGRDFGPNRAVSPAFIESIKARAMPIEIIAGENRTANIKVS